MVIFRVVMGDHVAGPFGTGDRAFWILRHVTTKERLFVYDLRKFFVGIGQDGPVTVYWTGRLIPADPL